MPVSETNTLTDWSIRRSGGGLVVTGKDAQGRQRKFTNVSIVHGGRTASFGARPLPGFTLGDGAKWTLAS
ncbi:Uncharacterised protein [Brevundimonas diminuta]|uniref:hypothetical protein n=1 Tax=Brevundimonas diminuta TaxID=293 RepID=UPI000207F7D4|nr:hypothetical protein [Brevundimonas diminuta]EGF94671.1 hypothetical protein BDIM_14950 [Brevundimonas diminuta ATCC 11568]OWR21768.1 hypothetical protein CD944_04930 [Brevundimonas diminuta]WQE46555.1 hypothetical protein U0020_06850 [Brevundimonas diminuta]SPU47987.1 Uncharacterised protein [Brevundimonas diminuta]SUW15809.1 Uncharacterised protein [Brevundimonas diminuta]